MLAEYDVYEDIRFDFEDFLEEHEQNLPEGLDPLYLSYAQVLERPIRNLKNLPIALIKLPVNAVLYQSWKSIMQIYLLMVILTLPSISSLMYVANLYSKGLVIGTMIFFIYIGLLAALVYMKTIYKLLNGLVESKRAPWLVEEIKDPFDRLYQHSWNKKIFLLSLIVPVVFEYKMVILLINYNILNSGIITSSIYLHIAMMAIGHLGFSLMVFISIVSFLFVIENTNIYDLLLVKIIGRVRGYTDGHESIHTKKNYEVIRVLSDTPGLSIQSMGDIPQLGLLSSILVFNGVLISVISPFLIDGRLADLIVSIGNADDPYRGLTFLIIFGILISSLAAFGAVIMPLFRISKVMGIFKRKALMELDPFLFDEITYLLNARENDISNETQILHILRGYVYTMKISPVAPLRLVYLVLISMVYGLRIIPGIIGLLAKFAG